MALNKLEILWSAEQCSSHSEVGLGPTALRLGEVAREVYVTLSH